MLGGLGPGPSPHHGPEGRTDASCTWRGPGQEGRACLNPLGRLPGSPGTELKDSTGTAPRVHLLSACCMPASRGPLDTQLAELQLSGPSTLCHSCSGFKGGEPQVPALPLSLPGAMTTALPRSHPGPWRKPAGGIASTSPWMLGTWRRRRGWSCLSPPEP